MLGQAASVTRVEFVNGSTDSGTYPTFGYFMANFRLQTSTNGTTWVDATGWTLTPAYPYGNSAGNQTYTFSGLATGVLGVRVVGQVGTSMYSGSWHVMAREVRVWGSGAAGSRWSFEAETLTLTSSSVGTNAPVDVNCPTGTCSYVQFNPGSWVGDWIEFTIPNLAAGTYGLTLYYKSNTTRGIVQASIDGVMLSPTCDEYATTLTYGMSCNWANATLATSGSHRLRFTVTGKNPSSSGYEMTIDSIVFTSS